MLKAGRGALKEIGAQSVAAIGITNQRETTIVWERATGKPLANAIVWQDRRTAKHCDELKRRGVGRACRGSDGARHRSLFLGDQACLAACERARASTSGRGAGEVCFGTVDSFLLFKLTGGKTACDRSKQRRPHHALRHQVRRMGRAASRSPRHPARNSPGAPRQPGRFRRGRSRAFRRGHSDQRRRRRPAGRGLRSGLLRSRHAEGDLRHRLLPARQYRRGEGRLDRAHARDRVSSARGQAHLRARGIDLHGRRHGAMAPRQPRLDRGRGGERGARAAAPIPNRASISSLPFRASARRIGTPKRAPRSLG